MKQADIAALCRYPCIIWDMDGTILDSMPYWAHLGRDYLIHVGITPPENLSDVIDAMTMEESARYFRCELGLAKTEAEIIEGVFALIEEKYRNVILAKEFAARAIPTAHAAGCRMCVLTTSSKELAQAALKRVGLLSCLEAVVTTDELGMDKRSGAIYEKTCEAMGFDIRQTLICEDVLHAVTAAKQTKAHVLAVYDAYSDADWAAMTRSADLYIR